jgi:radical SAM superfamily enzyme YgiQ (UPF0313 family)
VKKYQKRLALERGRPALDDRASVRIALAYPNRYEVGMASLGYQTVYRQFNGHPSVRCERVFLDEPRPSNALRTVESKETLNRFDMIGFSVSFELDIPNVIRTLMAAGIPPLSRGRTQAHPLVFLGGAIGGLNPSPLLPFMDGLLAGEGEGVLSRIADVLICNNRGPSVRQSRLEALSEIPGVFIPGLNASVQRHQNKKLDFPPAYTPMITPLSHFADMFVVETGRGCPKGCLFCSACKMYHPYRAFTMEAVLDAVKRFNPGAEKIGLEGAGLSDYPHLIPLCRSIEDAGLSVSFSSIRADRITREFLSILKTGSIRSFTIAPEAGTERLRLIIGKGMSDAVLDEKASMLSETAIDVLKLYYLIGLPGETDRDVEALAGSVLSVSGKFLGRSKTRRVRLSVNAFIPKAFTEYQWEAMNPAKELNRKRKRIAELLKKENRITIVPKSAREETLQGMLSLGGERAGTAVLEAIEGGKGFERAFADAGIDAPFVLYRKKGFKDVMPWDFIEYGVPKKQLWIQGQRG